MDIKAHRVSADELTTSRDYVQLLYDMVGQQWYIAAPAARKWYWSPITRSSAISFIEAGALISYHTV